MKKLLTFLTILTLTASPALACWTCDGQTCNWWYWGKSMCHENLNTHTCYTDGGDCFMDDWATRPTPSPGAIALYEKFGHKWGTLKEIYR